MVDRDVKKVVLKVFEDAYPNDVNIAAAAGLAGVSRNTASVWVRVLTGERKLIQTRQVGNAKMFRLRERPVKKADEQ